MFSERNATAQLDVLLLTIKLKRKKVKQGQCVAMPLLQTNFDLIDQLQMYSGVCPETQYG